jgi:hypothetical protein
MKNFSEWISTTFLSLFIQNNQAWMIPTIQSVHIVGISVVIGSILMVALRVLRLGWMDQSLAAVQSRFFPWLKGAIIALAVTGALLLVAEPARELMSFSFWAKMALIVIGLGIATAFVSTVGRNEAVWDDNRLKQGSIKLATVLTLCVWVGVIFMGRLIAYDHVWGSLSPSNHSEPK